MKLKITYEIDHPPGQPHVYKAVVWMPWGYMVAKHYHAKSYEFNSLEFEGIKKKLDLILKRAVRLQKKLKKPKGANHEISKIRHAINLGANPDINRPGSSDRPVDPANLSQKT